MKTRSNYVSNSSSSSFILKESRSTKHLTGKDWNDMIVDLFKDYEHRYSDCRALETEYQLEADKYPLFCAFDMKTDRGEALSYLKNILEGWMASFCVIVDGKIRTRAKGMSNKWDRFCDKVGKMVEHEMLREYGYRGAHASLYCHSKSSIRSIPQEVVVYDNDNNVKILQIDEKYLKLLEYTWDEMGLCDNYDVLQNDKARFVVHFSENECYSLKGMMDESGDWENDSGTYGRLCEVFAKWLVSHGKVPPEFSWRNLVNDTLTVNMHEG